MEVSQRQKRNKRTRGRDLPEGEPCKSKMARTEQVGTESGFAAVSPVGLSQAGVTWKAPWFRNSGGEQEHAGHLWGRDRGRLRSS